MNTPNYSIVTAEPPSFEAILATVTHSQSTIYDRKIGLHDMLARLQASTEVDVTTLAKNLLIANKVVGAVARLPGREASRDLVDGSIEEVVRRLTPNPLSAGLSRALELSTAISIANHAHRYTKDPFHVLSPLVTLLKPSKPPIKNEADYADAAAALLIVLDKLPIKDPALFTTAYNWVTHLRLPAGNRAKRIAGIFLKAPTLSETVSDQLALRFTQTIRGMYQYEPVGAEDCLKGQKARLEKAGRSDLVLSLIAPTELALWQVQKPTNALIYHLNKIYGLNGQHPAVL